MIHAQGPQRSDAGEAQTRSLLISSQALYHWATALPICGCDLLIFLWQENWMEEQQVRRKTGC